MADPQSARMHDTETEDAGTSVALIIALLCGVLGALASVVPGLFWLAWLLGAVAIVGSRPTRRLGRGSPGHGMARIAFGAGVFAAVVGLINLGIVFDWFTYFTTNPEALPAPTS